MSKNPYDLGSQIRFRILPKKRTLKKGQNGQRYLTGLVMWSCRSWECFALASAVKGSDTLDFDRF